MPPTEGSLASPPTCPSGYTLLCSADCPGYGSIAGIGGGAQPVSGIEVCSSECSSSDQCTSFEYGYVPGDVTGMITGTTQNYCNLNTCLYDELTKMEWPYLERGYKEYW